MVMVGVKWWVVIEWEIIGWLDIVG